jgi:uncharacterized protein (DUF983 family)
MNAGDPRQVETTLGSGELLCPHCASGYLVHRHCKSICERCGYVESCEDNFIPIRANPAETFG